MEQEEKIYDLLSSKSFDELSTQERTLVLQYMTEEDYELQRNIIGESEDLFEHDSALLVPDLESKSMPLAAMKAEKEEDDLPWFLAIFTVRVPAYAMVIPLLLLGFFWFYNGFSEEENNPKQSTKIVKVPELITQVDTVFVEKEVPVEVIKESVKIVRVEVPGKPGPKRDLAYVPVALMDKKGDYNAPINLDSANSILTNQLKNISQSAADRPELNQFRVSMQ